jgi:hypothetical protein
VSTVALDGPILLLALAGWAVAVVLAGGRLADPARDTEAADLVERARQALHAAGSFLILDIRDTFALPSSPPRRSSDGPSG